MQDELEKISEEANAAKEELRSEVGHLKALLKKRRKARRLPNKNLRKSRHRELLCKPKKL